MNYPPKKRITVVRSCMNCEHLTDDGRCYHGSIPHSHVCESFKPRRDLLE